MNYCVYKHTFPNGKIYIGITSMKPEYRWKKNGNGYRQQPLMYNAIQKFGWNNVRHEIIYYDLSKEDAEQIEINLILKYQSNNIKFGYNIASGGSAFAHSEETKRKIAAANSGEKNYLYGKHLSDETKRKLSESHKGVKKPPRSEEHRRNLSKSKMGHFVSDKTKKKISDSNKGKRCPEEKKIKLGHAVRCIETGKIYYSSKYAENETKINRINILRVCKDERKTAGGYHWEFVDKIEEV